MMSYPLFYNFRLPINKPKPFPTNSKIPILEIKCDSPITSEFPRESTKPQAKYVPEFYSMTSGDTLTVRAECSQFERQVHKLTFPPELIKEEQGKTLTVTIV